MSAPSAVARPLCELSACDAHGTAWVRWDGVSGLAMLAVLATLPAMVLEPHSNAGGVS